MAKEFIWEMSRPTGPPVITAASTSQKQEYYAKAVERLRQVEFGISFAGLFAPTSARWARAEVHAESLLQEARTSLAFHDKERKKT